MKKIIFILFIFFFYKGYSQVDTTKTWYGFTQVTTLNPTDLFLIRVGGTGGVSRNIQYQYLNRFTYSSPWLYPNASTINLALGVSSAPMTSGYKLYINGNLYLSNQLTFGASTPGIVFNGTSIINETASHDLTFYSPAYGSSVTLSEIMSQSDANNVASNGLTKTTVGSTNTWKLGGTLSEYTGIDAGAYTFQISNPSGGLFSLSGTSTTIRGTNILINPTGYVRLYTTTNDIRLRDTSFTATVEDGVFRMGNTSSEWTTAVDNDLVLRSGGGTGRVKIEDISYTQYTPQDTGIQVLGEIYLDDQDTIFRYWNGTSFVEFGSGGGTGDVSKSGTPVNGQMTGWTDDETIEGISELTYDTDTLHVAKNIEADDSVFLNYIGTGAVGFLIKTETGAIDTGTLVASKISESTDYVLFDGDTLATRIYSRSVGGGTGSATPAGVTGSVQLNDGGVMGYDANLSYTGDTLKVGTFYTFDGDRNTGMRGSIDELRLYAGGVQRINAHSTGVQIGTSGGIEDYTFLTTDFGGSNANGFAINKIGTSSTTVPIFLPNRSDNNTGLGRTAADQLNLISGGSELWRGYPDSNSFKKPIKVNALSGTTTRPAIITSTGQLSVGDDEEILHVATLNLSSANLLAGDSLQILAAPGAGKTYVIVKAALFYDYNSIAYTGSAIFYAINTYKPDGTIMSIISFTENSVTGSNDRVSISVSPTSGTNYSYENYSIEQGINKPLWWNNTSLNLLATGNGTAKLKIWYTIADFN